MRRGVLGFRNLLQLRTTRFWVALVCLWVALAPAWHVCAMSGHVMGMASHRAMHHEGMASLAEIAAAVNEAQESGPPRPLICYCAARPSQHHSAPPLRMVVSATPDAHHMDVTCLAQLLQTMPAQFAALPARPALVSFIVATQWRAPRSSASFAPRLQLRGRSPPLTI